MDRFSSPSVGTPREGAQSPPPINAPTAPAAVDSMLGVQGQDAGAKINENLKNIGKFFKRDLGGFGGLGGRFGGSKATSPAPPEDRS